MAANLVIQAYQKSEMANWTAPLAHLVRQALELRLKALFDMIGQRGGKIETRPLHSHNLKTIWTHSRDWLDQSGYRFREDARLNQTERLIEAFQAIDPSGDLFRFGISNQTVFGKQKSYDRVGLRMEILVPDFAASNGFLQHWELVLLREIMAIEMNWDKAPFFDAEDFPRVPTGSL
ncbi:hypothetical protein FHT80_003732 [Rhizobium sp. BK226]|jgi:hypothetical protein|uniref:hypothetical protein n=1 Tax=Rhizobium TaxID=379 RepID=UPI000BE97D95|nr:MULTISPECIES: hypothetical protein [Rhizobium]MBB4114381.1 hypothetical protein [Rhizobium sp. BK226]PDS58693.1 hypothetical protein CO663_13070 [Rhizobium anhuiense]PDS65623.1 hypothetical protein CO653_11875 [Rhizobium anhuiense]